MGVGDCDSFFGWEAGINLLFLIIAFLMREDTTYGASERDVEKHSPSCIMYFFFLFDLSEEGLRLRGGNLFLALALGLTWSIAMISAVTINGNLRNTVTIMRRVAEIDRPT